MLTLHLDVATIWAFNAWRYVLLIIDCFSQRIFCRAMKSKDKLIVREMFVDIFKEAGGQPGVTHQPYYNYHYKLLLS